MRSWDFGVLLSSWPWPPCLVLRIPHLDRGDWVDFPHTGPRAPDVTDMGEIMEEPAAEPDAPLTLTEIPQRGIRPAGMRRLEGGRHFGDELCPPRPRREARPGRLGPQVEMDIPIVLAYHGY
jgi:hypothetical protein